MGGPQSQYGSYGEEKNPLALREYEPRTVQTVVSHILIILPRLKQIH